MDRPGRKPKPPQRDGLCLSCEWAKSNFRESCYCIKYGYIIGYPKMDCKAYVNSEGRQHEQEPAEETVLRMGQHG